MKKFSTLFLLALLPLLASAYDAEVNGIYYYLVTNAKQAIVTSGRTRYTGRVIIPSSIKYKNVTYRVTSIGNYAFDECSNLKSVTIPASINSIEDYAFFHCTGLTSVTIPHGVTTIGKSAFWGCSSLKSVIIPNSVTTIGDGAFLCCSSLTSVKIPNSVTSIGSGAFWGCSSLSSVTIPKSVTSLGYRIFSECTSLKFISVENGNPRYKSRKNNTEIIESASNTVIASRNKTDEDSVLYKVNLQPSVIFKMCKTVVERSQEANVELIAKYANNNKDCKILVEGFANEWDVNAKTQKEWEGWQYMLSQKRADDVKLLLVKRYKIDPDRIIAKGCGFTDKLFEEVEFNRAVIFHDISK